MKSITLTEALSKKKLLHKKITKAIEEFAPCTATTKGTAPAGFESESAFDAKVKSDFESITTLMTNYYALQDAIVKTNALTEVTVTLESGEKKTLTIAQALIRKNQSAELEGSLRTRLSKFFDASQRNISQRQAEIPNLINAQIQTLSGRASQKVDQVQMDKIKESITDVHSLVLRDPIKILEALGKLDIEQEFYSTSLDVALSLANATTKIEVPDGV